MATANEKLQLTLNSKNAIKSALLNKGCGITDSTPLADYAGLINLISTGSTSSSTTEIVMNANGFDYVDLGLPSGTLWATCNVGAYSPEEYGWYFQWGGTNNVSNSTCNWNTYKEIDGNGSGSGFKKYNKNNTILSLEDDAALKVMGGDWHMPSKAQIEELLNHTNASWITINNIKGRKFVNKSDSSKYIFIPAAGCRDGSSMGYVGSDCYLWSSIVDSDGVYVAYYLYFYQYYLSLYYGSRYYGRSVRGVLLPFTQTKLNHGGVTAVVLTDDGTDSAVGNVNVYNHLQTLYIDGQVFDIDDLIITAGAGSGSGSGSGGSGGGIALPSTVSAGYHFIEYVLDDNYRNRTSDFEGCRLLHLTIPEKYLLKTNGFGYIDLGLPSGRLWATCNVGADKPGDYGHYFLFAGTNPKDGNLCLWKTTPYCTSTNNIMNWNSSDWTKYSNLNDELELIDDAANVNMGGDWKMPSKDDIKELLKYTTTEWIQLDGHYGKLFKSKLNGNSIFIPAAGYRNGSSMGGVDSYCSLWSSIVYSDSVSDAYFLCFNLYNLYLSSSSRYGGQSVRGVL